MADADPLIVSARLDPETQAYFDVLRSRHYPARRRHVGAHLILFHRLDPALRPRLEPLLGEAANRRLPLLAAVETPRSLGGGVAFGIAHPDLVELRCWLAEHFPDRLTPQDASWTWPHVTVQNRVSGAAARTLLRRLRSEPQPEVAMVIGLALWRYRDGPWEELARFGS